MRDSSQANEAQLARGPLLVVAGILALVVAAIGSVRAADGPSGGNDATVASQTANQPGDGGGVAGVPTDERDEGATSEASDVDDASDDDQATGDTQSTPDDEVAASEDGDEELDPVPTKPQELRDPIGLEDPAKFGIGLTARVVDVEAVQGNARGPGEIAGPALRVTIRATNNSARRIPLDNTFVDMSYGKQRTPGILLTGPGAEPFPESVAAGADATGSYVFNIPPRHRDRVQVTVTYAADVPTAVFAGPVR